MTSTELKLLGLKTLADSHLRALQSIVDAAIELTADPDKDHGHTSDWIWNSRDQRSPAKILDLTAKKHQ